MVTGRTVKPVDQAEVARMRDAQWYSVADFARMTGMTRFQVRGLLIQAGLIQPRGEAGGKKQMVSADSLRRKCPKLFWALREQMSRLAVYAPPSLQPPDPHERQPHLPAQMGLFAYSMADLVAYTGLSRFQLRRRLMAGGLTPPGRRRIFVTRADLMRFAPDIMEAIEARKELAQATAEVDAGFNGFGDVES